ncbi:MAG: Uma2 family endonuclease [Candidatus Competibacteraceae bacterium]
MSVLTQNRDMTSTIIPPITVHLQPVLNLSDEQLYAFSQLNRELQIERNARGELIIMPPTGGDTGEKMLKSPCNYDYGRNRIKPEPPSILQPASDFQMERFARPMLPG